MPLLLGSAEAGVNTGSVQTGMAQQVRQTAQIFFHLIVQAGKEVPQIVWEDLFSGHPGSITQSLHLMEDVAPIHWFSAAGYKDAPAADAAVFGVAFQFS